MSAIFGLARLTASDYQFAIQANQELLYGATKTYLEQANAEMDAAEMLFVQGVTTKLQERYQLPLSGRMQRTPEDQKAAALRRSGYLDVGYPLYNFSDNLTMTDVDFRYLTPEEFQSHVDGIIGRAAAARRHEILRRIFKSTTDTFSSKRDPATTIQPLANNDSVVYPPVIGEDITEAQENHYLATGYAPGAISDSNNPVKTAVAELREHYGRRTGGIETVTLISSANQDALEDLTAFTPLVPDAILPGTNTDDVSRVPGPGELIGYMNQSFIRVWDWIPDNYMVTIHTGVDAPLKRRIDNEGTGLTGGLEMASSSMEFPLLYNDWRLRFGYGTANRLNGVVTFIDAGAWAIPSDYQS